MRSFLVPGACATLLLAVSSAANAADLAPLYKAPAAIVAPYDWTGFYIGGHAGGAWIGSGDGTASTLPSAAAFEATTGPFGLSNAGSVIGGGQIGFNWQFAPNWVLGIEGDFSWTGLKESATSAVLTFPGGAPLVGAASAMTRDTNFLASVRGRFGYSWDRWLAYVTGGVVWADVDYAAATVFPAIAYTTAFSATRTGWVIGGGLEHALPATWGSWTIRGEYLFYSFDGASSIAVPTPANPPFAVQFNWADHDIHVVRFGLNYKFGTP